MSSEKPCNKKWKKKCFLPWEWNVLLLLDISDRFPKRNCDLSIWSKIDDISEVCVIGNGPVVTNKLFQFQTTKSMFSSSK